MKCPKCHYLGFETGDRCKHCGYDFSLMTDAARDAEMDLSLPLRDDEPSGAPDWLSQIDGALGHPATPTISLPPEVPLHAPGPPPPPAPAAQAAARAAKGLRPVPEPEPIVPAALRTPATGAMPDPRLPLFARTAGDDEPLIRVPATPRAPLAVRRTPDTPRLRAVPKPVARVEREPELFADTPAPEQVEPVRRADAPIVAGGTRSRIAAAAIDMVLLLAIDAAVIYLTLRMAGLVMADWQALPIVPLASFLLLLKLTYFSAFTAVGGQTIGKMAARIRVVTQDGAPVDGACAAKRTLASAASAALFGLGFIPAFLGPEGRALHDRLTQTRVIAI